MYDSDGKGKMANCFIKAAKGDISITTDGKVTKYFESTFDRIYDEKDTFFSTACYKII